MLIGRIGDESLTLSLYHFSFPMVSFAKFKEPIHNKTLHNLDLLDNFKLVSAFLFNSQHLVLTANAWILEEIILISKPKINKTKHNPNKSILENK